MAVAQMSESITMSRKSGGGKRGGSFMTNLKKRGDVKNPEALGAFLGRKAQGKSAFQAKAARAKSSQRRRN